jgi:hypothetical protein
LFVLLTSGCSYYIFKLKCGWRSVMKVERACTVASWSVAGSL